MEAPPFHGDRLPSPSTSAAVLFDAESIPVFLKPMPIRVPTPGKKSVVDVILIATGHKREELETELEGKKWFDMDAPADPFGTKVVFIPLIYIQRSSHTKALLQQDKLSRK